MENHSHFIIISKLSTIMNIKINTIDGLNNFYKIDIPITEEFYFNFKLSKSKEVLLTLDIDKKSIIDFEKYFKHSVNLTYQSEIIRENKKILMCKLEDIACF